MLNLFAATGHSNYAKCDRLYLTCLENIQTYIRNFVMVTTVFEGLTVYGLACQRTC